MTDKEKLDAIRAEIHRLVDVRGYDKEMANDLFAFMDSLPNEPVSDVLDEAAKKYAKGEYDRKNPSSLPWQCKGCYSPLIYAFKDGAQWQKQQIKKAMDLGEPPYLISVEQAYYRTLKLLED